MLTETCFNLFLQFGYFIREIGLVGETSENCLGNFLEVVEKVTIAHRNVPKLAAIF